MPEAAPADSPRARLAFALGAAPLLAGVIAVVLAVGSRARATLSSAIGPLAPPPSG